MKETRIQPPAILAPAPLTMSARLAELADIARTGRKVPAVTLKEAVEIAQHYQEERNAVEAEVLRCIEQIEILTTPRRRKAA